MKLNLPYGNSVDIKEPTQPEYINVLKYRFKIVDEYGWDITKSQARDMRINSVLEILSSNVLYHMYLTRPGKMETSNVFIDLGKSQLKIYGDDINIKFNCISLNQAEDIIDMILEPNEWEVSPVNKIK